MWPHGSDEGCVMGFDFDFDTPVNRIGSHSLKWDDMASKFGAMPDDVLPMWVADMDFRSPEPVNEALRWSADQGVHGYFGDFSEFNEAFFGFMKRRHGWVGDPSWITISHGLVNAIALAVQAYSDPGDKVVVFSPVYHQFAGRIRDNDRVVLESPLRLVQGRYEMDFDLLAEQVDERTKMVLLCSPHNPGGRVWTGEELKQLAAFCIEHDLILVSDEIHQDLVYDDHTHVVTLNAAPEAADRIVTLVAPTKTFNIAGGLTGVVVIPDEALRAKYMKRKMASGALAANRLGLIASTAAYQQGEPWLDALVPYLQANRDHIDATIASEIPGVRSMPLEATYLSWIDFSGTGMEPDAVADRLRNDARIIVNPGPSFGTGGENFMRFNFACPRATLDQGLERLVKAFS